MTFQPIIPVGGIAGWQILQRTEGSQRETYAASGQTKRDLDYFREQIGDIKTPEQLVGDFRLLRVALGAFGLDDDIGNKYFIKTVLEEGTTDDDALANKLSDKRYLALSRVFGFGDFDTPNTALSTFPNEIAAKFTDRSFETAVGQTNDDMRLALNMRREIGELAKASTSQTTKWFTILGTPPLRVVFEGALNLPTSFGSLPIDRQLEEIQLRAESVLGTSDPADLGKSEITDLLIQRFLVSSSIEGSSGINSPAANALILLGGR